MVCYTILLLSWVCWFLMGFLLCVPLTSSVLGFSWHNDINCISVLYFTGIFNLCILWLGSRACSPVSLVRGDKVLQCTSWLYAPQTLWPCLIVLSQFPYSTCTGSFLAFCYPVTPPQNYSGAKRY